SGSPNHADSEEVVKVTGMAQVDRTAGRFWPSSWRNMDQNDLDFGSVSPVVITVPGATPGTIVAATSKDGHFYLLNPANLGGMGTTVVSPMGGCQGVRDWTSPIAVKGRIVVGGDGRLCSWSPH